MRESPVYTVMAKTLLQLMNEAPPAMPMGGLGGGPPGLGGGPMGGLGGPGGGGLPPPPPMGGGGGLGPPPLGGGPGMGGMGQGQQQPVPVKTIDVMDVWEVLKHAINDMERHKELNLKYDKKPEKKEEEKPKKIKKKSALVT